MSSKRFWPLWAFLWVIICAVPVGARPIYVTGERRITVRSTNNSVPADEVIDFNDKKDRIYIEEGAEFTVEGHIQAPPHRQIFDGPGKLNLSRCKNNDFPLGWFGATTDNPADDDAQAFKRLQDALMGVSVHSAGMDSKGRTVSLLAGTYNGKSTAFIRLPLTIRGPTPAMYQWTTRWLVPHGVTAFRLASHNENKPAGGSAHGAIVENLGIFSEPTPSGSSSLGAEPAHGIHMSVVATIQNCWIGGFSGDGIHVRGNTATTSAANSSLSFFHRVQCRENKGNGIYLVGGDSNVCIGQILDLSYNGKAGLNDKSFLGNLWLAVHCSFNGRSNLPGLPLEARKWGAFHCGLGDDETFAGARPSRSTFINCYSEGGDGLEGPSKFSGGTLSLNDNYSAGTSSIYPGQIISPTGTRFTVVPHKAQGLPDYLRGLTITPGVNGTAGIVYLDAQGKVISKAPTTAIPQ